MRAGRENQMRRSIHGRRPQRLGVDSQRRSVDVMGGERLGTPLAEQQRLVVEDDTRALQRRSSGLGRERARITGVELSFCSLAQSRAKLDET